METRIKYIKRKNSWYYAVQVKRWIFWKTLKLCFTWVEVENFLNTLKEIEEFNSKTKSLNKIVYDGWVVRNVHTTGIDYVLKFFESCPRKYKTGNNSETIWEDCNGSLVPTMKIKCKKLFGKECLEPMKVRITIEQTEEQYK
jgi:hypothetical protein